MVVDLLLVYQLELVKPVMGVQLLLEHQVTIPMRR